MFSIPFFYVSPSKKKRTISLFEVIYLWLFVIFPFLDEMYICYFFTNYSMVAFLSRNCYPWKCTTRCLFYIYQSQVLLACLCNLSLCAIILCCVARVIPKEDVCSSSL